MKACYLALVYLLVAGAAAAQEIEPITVGQSYERILEAGRAHTYMLSADSGRFVSGRVDQHGVDVKVTVTGPDDKQVARLDSPTGISGPEHFRFITEGTGQYRIEVAPVKETGAGRYAIRLQRVEPVATTPEGKVDQMMAMFDKDTPGAVVAVIRGGKIDFSRSYGLANLTHDIPFNAQTVTNIGSTSKQFTAFALALLAARGKLSLDDDVRKYFPELPDLGETITLRHLLTHTSGYREFVNTLALGGRQILAGDQIDRDEVIEVVRRQPRLQNKPGAEFNYNNTGFGLLTMVVERVTGRSFPEWMDEEVFEPLGMKNTTVRAHPGEIIPNRSMGYVAAEDGFREVQDLGASMGAGGIYTTVGDLARWMENLHTAKLGGPEVMRQMTTRFVLTDGDTTQYGLGLFIDTNRGLRRVHHGGADVAHRSSFVYYPDLDAGYVVLSNFGGMPGSIAGQVAEAFFGEHMAKEKEAAPTAAAEAFRPELFRPETFDAYIGRYELEAMPGVVLTISRDTADRMLLQATDQPATELVPTSDSTFTLASVDASVTFHRGEGNEVNALTLHQNGNHRAQRVSDAEEVNLTAFTGQYFSEELGTFYTLAVEDGELTVRHRRFGPVTLTHSKGDTFKGSFPIAEMSFERDEGGQVTGFRAGNGRARDIWFEKRNH